MLKSVGPIVRFLIRFIKPREIQVGVQFEIVAALRP